MTKQAKILIIFIPVAILAFSFLLFFKDGIKSESKVNTEKQVNQEEMMLDYKNDLKKTINDLSLAVASTDFSADMARSARNKIQAQTVPAEFRDLHMKLFQAVTKIEDSMVENDMAGKNSGWEEIEKIKKENPWLN